MKKQSMPSRAITTTRLILPIISLLCLLLYGGLSQAGVTAQVDRQYAYEGEAITLSIRAENSGNGEPDFSPLSKDFIPGGTSQSSQISIINGNRSDSRTWSIRLQPRRLGKIEIPPISIGSQSTQALTIEIKPIPEQSGAIKGQPLFLTLEVANNTDHFYIQQHIPVVARLYYKHQISEGHIADPAPENATLERLGDDSNYTAKYNGQDYQVFERHYSVFAEKSGDLHIPPVTFRGYMNNPQSHNSRLQRNDPFAQFFGNSPLRVQGQPVSVKSQSLDLTIESHPGGYTGQQWLPAESLTLSDSWSASPPEFKVGEPVSRTITLEAKGLVASQIQPLELPAISSFRRYAEPAETATHTDGENVYASSRRTFTYIPAYAGKQTIPQIELNWWNVISQKQETAVLPAWNITVEKGIEPAAPPPAKTSPAPQATQQPATATSAATTDDTGAIQTLLLQLYEWLKDWWYWLAGAVVVVLLLLKLLLDRPAQPQNATATSSPLSQSATTASPAATHISDNKRQLLADFRTACENNNARQAAQALLQMAQLQWPENPPRSMGALAERLSDGQQALLELDKYLYSDSGTAWDGAKICRLYSKGLLIKPASGNKQQDVLKPLYPETDSH